MHILIKIILTLFCIFPSVILFTRIFNFDIVNKKKLPKGYVSNTDNKKFLKEVFEKNYIVHLANKKDKFTYIKYEQKRNN